jgi:hypothetical protein
MAAHHDSTKAVVLWLQGLKPSRSVHSTVPAVRLYKSSVAEGSQHLPYPDARQPVLVKMYEQGELKHRFKVQAQPGGARNH